jgi:hypothetical protein
MGDFKAAGTIFTNGSTVLAGYQKEDRSPSINGIGGKRTGTETYMQTALRETVEELFGVRDNFDKLIRALERNLVPTKIYKSGNYVLVLYTFKDLEVLLQCAATYLKKSPLYTKFPKTLSNLLLDRDANVNPRPEIIHLCILPVVKGCYIDSQLIDDFSVINPALDDFHAMPAL